MAYATQLAPARTAVVRHQEHRSSSQRQSSRDLLLDYARRADVVAMLTEPMAAWMAGELGAAAPELVVMPNALPPGFRPRSRLTEPVILSAGRLGAEKQWPLLISAFGSIADQIPEWRLRIFGDGPARFDARAMTRKLGLWDRVELPGPTQDLDSEWSRASIMSLTSGPGEGFPLVVQEAMAAGVPVVVVDVPSGLRDQITDGVDGLLVTQGSQAGLAAALLRLATDRDERLRLGAAAVAKAATWDSATITARWVEIYEAAAKRRTGATGRSTAVLTRHVTDPPQLPPPADQAPEGREGRGLTPVQARREGFAAVVRVVQEVAGQTDHGPWFVQPPRAGRAPVLVLPMPLRTAFLHALERAELPAWLSVHDPDRRGWPSRRGTAAELVGPLLRGRTARLLLEPWPLVDATAGSVIGRACETVVEFWEVGQAGNLHAVDLPTYTTVMPRDAEFVLTEVLGTTVPVHPLMLEPTVDDCTFDVDLVYTWVDGNDPAWDSARRERLAGVGGAETHTVQAGGPARYVDRGELRYSMRGVHLYAPWVRTIHLVTDQQVPAWLDVDHPRINLVDHRDLLPADALPTFNSHAIEAALHRIPGLSEHFVYFNDDVFLGQPAAPEQFFNCVGATAAFVSSTTVGLPGVGTLPWQTAETTTGGCCMRRSAGSPSTRCCTPPTRSGSRCCRRSRAASTMPSRQPCVHHSVPPPTSRCLQPVPALRPDDGHRLPGRGRLRVRRHHRYEPAAPPTRVAGARPGRILPRRRARLRARPRSWRSSSSTSSRATFRSPPLGTLTARWFAGGSAASVATSGHDRRFVGVSVVQVRAAQGGGGKS